MSAIDNIMASGPAIAEDKALALNLVKQAGELVKQTRSFKTAMGNAKKILTRIAKLRDEVDRAMEDEVNRDDDEDEVDPIDLSPLYDVLDGVSEDIEFDLDEVISTLTEYRDAVGQISKVSSAIAAAARRCGVQIPVMAPDQQEPSA